MKTVRAVLVLALLGVARLAAADSWFPPRPQVAVSEDGGWYVIVQPQAGKHGEMEFLLVKKGESEDPLPKGPETGGFEETPRLAPRAGDAVVAQGTCHAPIEVRCRNGGKGFLLFENWGSVGYGTSAALHDGKGEEVWEKGLSDFFGPDRIQGFSHTASSIWWYSGLWIDEEAGDLVVLHYGTPPGILRVSLADGSSRAGKPEDLLARIGRGTEGEQVAALDLALQAKPEGLAAAAKRGLGRADLPRAVRLRLAVALAGTGDLAGKDLLVSAAQDETDVGSRKYALANLPAALGPAAIPILQEAMRGTATDARWSAVEGLVALGDAAVPTLVAMLQETSESTDYRGGAAHGLGELGAKARAAIPALVKATEDPQEYVANAALNAAVAIEDPAVLAPLLIPILERGSTQDGRLASFFDENPSRAAVPGLIAALSRQTTTEGYPYDTIVDALEKSTGAVGVGRTAAAWRDWWARQAK